MKQLPHSFLRFLPSSAMLFAFLLAPAALAQTTYTWTGAGANNLWSTPANWASGSAPSGLTGSTDAIILGLPTATTSTVTSLDPWYLQTLSFAANSASVSLTGNDLNFSSATVVSTTVINAGVNGTFNHSISNNLTLVNWNVIRSGLQSGGNLTLSGNITSGSGSNNILFRGIGNASLASGVIGGSGSSKVNVQKFDSGTWTFSNSANRISSFIAGGGKTVVGANNALGDGVALSIGNSNSVGNVIVDLGGYSQRVSGLTGVSGDHAANRQIVTNSSSTASTLTYERTAASGHQTFAGQLTGNLSLVKRGSNTLTLTNDGIHANSGENTFTGSTTIAEGTLLLAGDATISQTSGISVASGAVFDVSQTSAGFTLQAAQAVSGAGVILNTGKTFAADGTLSPQGTLTIDGGTLALGSSASFVFSLGVASSQLFLTNGATLTLGSGTLGFGDFIFTPTAGFGIGQYVLISGASSLNGSLDLTHLDGSIGGLSGTLALSGNDLVLNVVPEPGVAGLLCLASLLVFLRFRRQSVA